MKEKYIPGEGCLCHAHSEAECGCDADWTPREVYELREQRDRLAYQIEANHKLTLMLERMVYQSREQRDMLAEAIRKHRDELELTSGDSVDRILWNTLATVKENQKTDNQSCPECDVLASHGSNDGPCETHKL
jgi:hypothetical protein